MIVAYCYLLRAVSSTTLAWVTYLASVSMLLSVFLEFSVATKLWTLALRVLLDISAASHSDGVHLDVGLSNGDEHTAAYGATEPCCQF